MITLVAGIIIGCLIAGTVFAATDIRIPVHAWIARLLTKWIIKS